MDVADNPAFIVTSPPVSLLSPTFNEMEPAAPEVDAPLETEMDPEFDPAAVPVVMDTAPLEPLDSTDAD